MKTILTIALAFGFVATIGCSSSGTTKSQTTTVSTGSGEKTK
jgi:hypothetical protein